MYLHQWTGAVGTIVKLYGIFDIGQIAGNLLGKEASKYETAEHRTRLEQAADKVGKWPCTHGALLADGTVLGKTMIELLVATFHGLLKDPAEAKPTLFLVLASLNDQTIEEVAEAFGPTSSIPSTYQVTVNLLVFAAEPGDFAHWHVMKMIDLLKVIEGEDENDENDEVPAQDGEVEEQEELPEDEDEDEDKPAVQPQQTPMPQAAEDKPEPTMVEIYYAHLVELAAVRVVLSQAHLALKALACTGTRRLS